MASTVVSSLPPLVETRVVRMNRGDRIFRGVLRLVAGALLLLVVALAAEMFRAASPAIQKFGLRFVFTSVWDPVAEHFGALPFVYGTLVSSFLAMLTTVANEPNNADWPNGTYTVNIDISA